MINLDAFGLQKFSHRHKISVCRDKHSDIISIRPCQTDHVSDDACIYALFFRARMSDAHVGHASTSCWQAGHLGKLRFFWRSCTTT